jgi:hypothetical protein
MQWSSSNNQAPNHKEIPNIKFQCTVQRVNLMIEHWNSFGACDLDIGV